MAEKSYRKFKLKGVHDEKVARLKRRNKRLKSLFKAQRLQKRAAMQKGFSYAA